jgi:hypothetical protein
MNNYYLRRRGVVFVLLLAAFLTPGPGQAWNGQTHEELARQAVLYLLRSGAADLRLAGIVLTTAGEGMNLGREVLSIGFKRRWPLAEEAKNVDNYREVALRNKGAALTLEGMGFYFPPILYEAAGYGFSAFNHFLLLDKLNDPWLSANKHDNYPGFSLYVDESSDEFPAVMLKRAGTPELQRLCREGVNDFIREKGPWYLDLANSIFSIAEDIGEACPYLVVEEPLSPALALYRNNSSDLSHYSFQGKDMTTTVWHPVDNMASAGEALFLSSPGESSLTHLYNKQFKSQQEGSLKELYEGCQYGWDPVCLQYLYKLQKLCPQMGCAFSGPFKLSQHCRAINSPGGSGDSWTEREWQEKLPEMEGIVILELLKKAYQHQGELYQALFEKPHNYQEVLQLWVESVHAY